MEIDLSRLDFATARKVDEIFRGDHELRVLRAIKRQTRLAAMNYDGERSRNGFGARRFEIDAVIDAVWRQYYGHDYTSNQDLMRFLAKRNPEIKVKSRGTKIMVGYQPGSGSRRPINS